MKNLTKFLLEHKRFQITNIPSKDVWEKLQNILFRENTRWRSSGTEVIYPAGANTMILNYVLATDTHLITHSAYGNSTYEITYKQFILNFGNQVIDMELLDAIN